MNRNLVVGGFALLLVGGGFIAQSASPINYSLAVLGIVLASMGFVLLGRGVGRKVKPLTVRHDPIALLLDGLFFLVILFGGLGGLFSADQASQNLANFLIEFNVVALVMATVTRVIRLGVSVGKVEFRKELFLIAATMGMFFILNLVVPPSVPLLFRSQSLASSGKFVADLISIPESNFFQGWLAPWLGNLSKTGAFGGAIASGLLGIMYHFYVLGTNPAGLIIVFGAFTVASLATLRTRLQSASTIPHFLNNFISTGGF